VISTRARPPARDLAPRLKLIEPTGTDRLTGEPAVEHVEPCGERRKFLSDHDRDHGRGTTRLRSLQELRPSPQHAHARAAGADPGPG
jgi:hypothetical protein